jgi:hypothetical protein
LAQPDYFHAITSDIGSSLVTIGYSQTSVLTTGQQVATIDFGLSILVSPPDVIFGNTGFGSTGLGTTIQYQALLSSAAARGASNDPLYPRFSTAGNDFAAALDTSGGFQDNGTFQVTPTQIIPEPASFLLFSGLGFVWLAGAGFRRRKISS